MQWPTLVKEWTSEGLQAVASTKQLPAWEDVVVPRHFAQIPHKMSLFFLTKAVWHFLIRRFVFRRFVPHVLFLLFFNSTLFESIFFLPIFSWLHISLSGECLRDLKIFSGFILSLSHFQKFRIDMFEVEKHVSRVQRKEIHFDKTYIRFLETI